MSLADKTQALPLPIAQLLRRQLNAKSALERHGSTFFACEAVLKLAAIARLAWWLERAREPGTPVAARLDGLALPSLGHWTDLLRAVDELPALPARFGRLSALPAPDALRTLGRAMVDQEIAPAELARGAARDGLLGWCALLVRYRNKVVGHGALRATGFYERFNGLLGETLDGVLAVPALFGGLRLAACERTDGGLRWRDLVGLGGVAAGEPDAADGAPVTGRLYLRGDGGAIPVHPLAAYREDPRTGREQVAFLNGTVLRRRAGAATVEVRHVDYLDYATGESLAAGDAAAAVAELLVGMRGDAVGAAAAPIDDDEVVSVGAGDTVGEFVLGDELGRGAAGVVYKALQSTMGRVVALKLLAPELLGVPAAVTRFERETRALARCDHANVVKILTSGTTDGRPWFAMEYVDGTDLAHCTAADLPDDPRRLAGLFAGAAEGLHHLHAQEVLHRDIKPGNLLYTRDGARIVIMDLGLARLQDVASDLTRTDGEAMGTLRYVAPEALDGTAVDARADVFGLGAALLQVARTICGEQRVPGPLSAIVDHATARDPANRYPDARSLAADLTAYAEGRPIRGPGGGARAPRSWLPVKVLAALLGLATVVTVIYAVGRGGPGAEPTVAPVAGPPSAPADARPPPAPEPAAPTAPHARAVTGKGHVRRLELDRAPTTAAARYRLGADLWIPANQGAATGSLVGPGPAPAIGVDLTFTPAAAADVTAALAPLSDAELETAMRVVPEARQALAARYVQRARHAGSDCDGLAAALRAMKQANELVPGSFSGEAIDEVHSRRLIRVDCLH
ncbi:MAG TPA: serine/threonine-protein kinase [Kofleriaceae bacterium]|nr:serine/threonine-protein kinase [Kofleriaceae bacterium]